MMPRKGRRESALREELDGHAFLHSAVPRFQSIGAAMGEGRR
jgi:hypothetical protein